MRFLIAILMIATFSFASSGWKMQSFEWTAYKTPKKVGVKGHFDSVEVDGIKAQKGIAALKGAKMSINPSSVNSGNKGRDLKLVKFFFNLLKADDISGEIVSATPKKVVAKLMMNGKSKNITLWVKKATAKRFELHGVVNVLDFGMRAPLSSITKACYKLHQGKTWPDVSLVFVFKR